MRLRFSRVPLRRLTGAAVALTPGTQDISFVRSPQLDSVEFAVYRNCAHEGIISGVHPLEGLWFLQRPRAPDSEGHGNRQGSDDQGFHPHIPSLSLMTVYRHDAHGRSGSGFGLLPYGLTSISRTCWNLFATMYLPASTLNNAVAGEEAKGFKWGCLFR